MTENLLQKLEEKTMNILTELEKLRSEVKQLKHENVSLRAEKDNSSRKLQDIMSLLDSTENQDSAERVFLQAEASAA